MKLFRRNSQKWPGDLERRKPENSGLRKQLEKAHRERLLLIAQEAARITDENEERIDMVRTAMRSLGR